MSLTWVVGILGSLTLVVGAALPERKVVQTKSVKNWLLAAGGLLMLVYSALNYAAGGPIFFVFLQVLVNIASVFMMFNVSDDIDTPIMCVAGIGLIIWSLALFEGYSTIFFILGLTGIAMGYVMQTGTFRRSLALTLGSALIALFSYLSASWIFFWLNVFFALFSAYNAWQTMGKPYPRAPIASPKHRTPRRSHV
jgi:hypothetical protein